MPTFEITSPRGKTITIDADNQDLAMQGAQRWDIEDHASAEAQRLGVDPSLALGVLHQESGANPSVKPSSAGALGPMQLMPGTAKDLGVDPADPYQNVTGGIAYLKQQLDAFGGDKAKALAAYNAGPGAVQKYGGVPPYEQTQNYVKAILGSDQPQRISTSHNGGVSVDLLPQTPPPAPAVQPKTTSQALGFMEGLAHPLERFNDFNDATLGRLPGVGGFFHSTPTDAQARQGMNSYFGKREQTQSAGGAGKFLGNVAATSMLPGGPMVNGALSGALLSNETDPGAIVRDTVLGGAFGKAGGAVMSGLGKAVSGVTNPYVRLLASKGVPLTLGQLGGGIAHGVEDKMTSVPVLGDMIRNAQRQGVAGAQRAAYNDTLGQIGQTLPDHVDLGHAAYNHTKQALGDAYDAVLKPLTVQRDPAFNSALKAAKAQIAKIGNASVRSDALNALKTSVESRFDKAGSMIGDDLKDAQSDLGSHINDLFSAAGPGATWSRKAGDALAGAKSAVEDLVSRTDAAAGQNLAKVNSAYSLFKPLEAATKAAGVKDGGQFTLNQFAQGVAKGKRASAVASGNAPHQALATAASQVLPSTVPDSGTAGRTMMTMLLGGMLGGAHHLPVVGPAAIPAAGLIGGMAGLYTRGGQKALTSLATTRNDAARLIGQYISRLSAPAGTTAAALAPYGQ